MARIALLFSYLSHIPSHRPPLFEDLLCSVPLLQTPQCPLLSYSCSRTGKTGSAAYLYYSFHIRESAYFGNNHFYTVVAFFGHSQRLFLELLFALPLLLCFLSGVFSAAIFRGLIRHFLSKPIRSSRPASFSASRTRS